jgi:hypothetical protein
MHRVTPQLAQMAQVWGRWISTNLRSVGDAAVGGRVLSCNPWWSVVERDAICGLRLEREKQSQTAGDHVYLLSFEPESTSFTNSCMEALPDYETLRSVLAQSWLFLL